MVLSTFIHYIVSLLLYSKLETILAYYFNNIPDAPNAPDAEGMTQVVGDIVRDIGG